jgi:alanyl-tRNA synthetase
MGAARRVLGEHVWQAGTQKDVDKTRLDFSHFRRLTFEEIHKIEELANEAVIRNLPVDSSWKPRMEAEKQYGFRLYQGGVVPGREIRVVDIKNWDVEACGGTHVKNTGEIGFIKILHSERIQDGVERIVFSAGLSALKAVQQKETLLWKIAEKLSAPLEKLEPTAERVVNEWRQTRKEKERLIKELAGYKAKEYLEKAEEIHGLKIIIQAMKEVSVDNLIQIASETVKMEPKAVLVLCTYDKTARVVVMVGKEALKHGVNARRTADETASMLGGGGSGRPDFAQGGGTRTEKVSEAMRKAMETIKRQIETD